VPQYNDSLIDESMLCDRKITDHRSAMI